MAKNSDPKNWITSKASALGFDACHFTTATLPDEIAARLVSFLDQDFHGEMTWMEETKDRRASPDHMWEDAQSAILLAMNYGPDHNPLETLKKTDKGNVSVYARGKDYHEVIKGKLKQLAGQVAAKFDCHVKVFVDTAPLMEKPLAQQAGIGWQGKHTNLVSRTFGSWLFLGTILLDKPLIPDQPISDHCGNCTACLDICPTNAFAGPYQLDARKCISYMTIEQKSQIDIRYRAAIGNRIFGCDDCLAICPWNKFASLASEQKLHPRHEPALLPLSQFLQMDEPAFRSHFAGMPVRRAGFERFMRNVLIAAGNANDQSLVPLIKPYLVSDMVLVRSMAVWALSCYENDMRPYYRPDASVIVEAEWQRALA